MNDPQWKTLVAAVRGESISPLPTAFIIDSPWLPNWAGHTILDYFTSEHIFLEDNLKAIRAFPEAIFLPGFWSEYGMCTEPSAFGAVSMWGEDEFPFAKKVLLSPAEVERLEKPNPRKHGLLPFVVKRLQHLQPEIEAVGHKIRFAVARGPLNIASFLMGTPEFLEATKTHPELMHRLLDLVTDFLVEWIAYQREVFPSIDGILLLTTSSASSAAATARPSLCPICSALTMPTLPSSSSTTTRPARPARRCLPRPASTCSTSAHSTPSTT